MLADMFTYLAWLTSIVFCLSLRRPTLAPAGRNSGGGSAGGRLVRLSTRGHAAPPDSRQGGISTQPLQSLAHAVGGPEARLIRPRSPGRWECRATIHSEQAPEAIRLNTTMMTDLTALAATLLANFRTFRIPAPDDHQRPSDDWWMTAKARRAEKRAAYACRDRLRRELTDHGHRFLDRLEADPDGGWRLHIFVADDYAVGVLDTITQGACGPGDPVTLDPEEFISEQLRRRQCADECL
jgi:hypothetical protein